MINPFDYKFIRKSEYRYLIECSKKIGSVALCYRWFSGWNDLDIIWKYIMEDTKFGGIERAREDYAKARGTDEYGKPNA